MWRPAGGLRRWHRVLAPAVLVACIGGAGADGFAASEASSWGWSLDLASRSRLRSRTQARGLAARRDDDDDAAAKLTKQDSEAVDEFNHRALRSRQDLDEVLITCRQKEQETLEELAGIEAELTQYKAQLSENLGIRSAASLAQEQEERRRGEMKADLQRAKDECEAQLASEGRMGSMADKDLETAQDLQAAAGRCGRRVHPAALLQRGAAVRFWADWQARRAAGEQAFDSEEVEEELGLAATSAGGAMERTWARLVGKGRFQLRSRIAQRFFRQALRQAQHRLCKAAKGTGALRRAGRHVLQLQEALRRVGQDRGMSNWPGKAGAVSAHDPTPHVCENDLLDDVPTEQKCMALSVELRRMVARLEAQVLQSEVDKHHHMEDCQSRKKFVQLLADESERRQSEAASDLSRALGDNAGLTATYTAKVQEQREVRKQLKDLRQDCEKRAEEYRAEIKAAVKLREALLPKARDCQVSAWSWSPCPQKCMPRDGTPGAQEGVRETLLPPSSKGMQCPPLDTKVACGTRPCPQDCQMGGWESWTSCSTECGGGTRTRARPVVVEARRGGDPCPVSEEREMCNIQACDVDCVLKDWSDWSPCSRACRLTNESNAGRQSQVRQVQSQPRGRGKCPKRTDGERFRDRRCNDQMCSENATCVGSEDVLVVMDGSDSADFDAQRQLVERIVARSAEGMHFGAVTYGSNAATLSAVTTNRTAFLAAVRAGKAPGGDPDLAAGEALARTLILAAGAGAGGPRAGAALILTDGAPIHFNEARAAARALRDDGVRVLIGIVDEGLAENRRLGCDLVGEPCAGSIEAFDSWEEMAKQPMRFLAALCEKLVPPPSSDSNSWESMLATVR